MYFTIRGIEWAKVTYNLGERELKEVSKILSDFQITLYDIESVRDEVVAISQTYGISIYDSAYVALGKVLGD